MGEELTNNLPWLANFRFMRINFMNKLGRWLVMTISLHLSNTEPS